MSRTITREAVKAGLDAGSIVLVDALPAAYFHKQHLPGALNLVAEDVATHASELLPHKDASIVTYCANPACPNSTQVARALVKLGYTDVAKYPGGIQDWTEAGLPTETETETVASN